ncbi:hypothetical protein GN244_ATG18851 [Phytophthora infestans]|uniref:CCHC-type domain-containing protein n=1 Tax=Phytophthora infestans TaxID=4787 RepID=A0A833SF41_PHYIN|nr:hypothetical protein GN244_ATG18848 [Phytophthora infestans]KAF4029412.1 hypothetical protein GN244_ATG18851 [Phytophthora infestans]
MQRRPCAKCGKLGHKYRECWQKDDQNSGNQQKSNGSRGPSSLGGGRRGGRGGGQHGKSGPKSFMANIGGVLSVGGPDVVEWCLDSAATASICNDLSQFTEISASGDGLEKLCANGNTVSINQAGTVKFLIINELTGRQEKRLLPDVYYVPEAPVNLLSQDYMQTQLNYVVSISADQSLCYLTKEGMRLKFVKVDGLYRLWSSRQHKKKESVIFSAIVSSSKYVPLAVWHK